MEKLKAMAFQGQSSGEKQHLHPVTTESHLNIANDSTKDSQWFLKAQPMT